MIVDLVFGAQGRFSGRIAGKSMNEVIFGRFAGQKTGGALICGGFAGVFTSVFCIDPKEGGPKLKKTKTRYFCCYMFETYIYIYICIVNFG